MPSPGKRVVNEEFWDQQLARALILWSNLLASLFMLLEAVVSNSAVHWSLPSKRVAGLKHRRLILKAGAKADTK